LREEQRSLVLRKGLSYGWLAARRRIREMVLPAVTTATGAFLVVIVFGMSDGIRAQSASLGHAEEISRAVVLIAVTVLLVGVVEVAVATTRTVAHRTRELGVLGANGVPRTPVVAALLVEPVIAAVLGALVGALLAAVAGIVLGAVGVVGVAVLVGVDAGLVGVAVARLVDHVAAALLGEGVDVLGLDDGGGAGELHVHHVVAVEQVALAGVRGHRGGDVLHPAEAGPEVLIAVVFAGHALDPHRLRLVTDGLALAVSVAVPVWPPPAPRSLQALAAGYS